MFRPHSWYVMALLVWLALSAVAAGAQTPARSFDQLGSRVRPGDTVTVSEVTGGKVTGVIAGLSSASLVLIVEGTRRDLKETDVTAIRQRQSDPLTNGLLWGGAIGAGAVLGAARGGLAADGPWRPEPTLAMAAVFGGIGCAVGAGIDALFKAQRVIYVRPAMSVRVTVLPLLNGERKGALVSLRF